MPYSANTFPECGEILFPPPHKALNSLTIICNQAIVKLQIPVTSLSNIVLFVVGEKGCQSSLRGRIQPETGPLSIERIGDAYGVTFKIAL